jgi:hypothetical protein
MSPTLGPISIVLAADTIATVLASGAAMRHASIAVLTTSLGTLPVYLRPLIERDPCVQLSLQVGNQLGEPTHAAQIFERSQPFLGT